MKFGVSALATVVAGHDGCWLCKEITKQVEKRLGKESCALIDAEDDAICALLEFDPIDTGLVAACALTVDALCPIISKAIRSGGSTDPTAICKDVGRCSSAATLEDKPTTTEFPPTKKPAATLEDKPTTTEFPPTKKPLEGNVSGSGPKANCANQETYDSYWTSHSAKCTSTNCNAPQYWVVADANGKANVVTFNNQNDAYNAQGGFSWWDDYVTRELYDMNSGRVLEHTYSCTGAEEELTHWLRESQDVDTCKYAGGDWIQVGAWLTPSSAWSELVSVDYGYSTTIGNSWEDSISVSATAKAEFFEATGAYSYVASTTESKTWNYVQHKERQFSGDKGTSAVWWQYYLTCQGFNRQGLYVGKLQFATTIFKGTQGPNALTPPAENPPQGGSMTV